MLVVCLNPTMDRQVFLSELIPGSVSRASSNRRLAGGKPVDVLRAMAAHDFAPPLLVALPKKNDGYLDLLAAEGIAAEAFEVPGELRETIVLYEGSGRSTVVNGQGHPVSSEVWQALTAELLRRAAAEDWVVISGSFPPGISGLDVAQLIDALHDVGARVALDTGPVWLQSALASRPDLITPNLSEAALALSAGTGVEAVEFGEGAMDEALAAARQLVAFGIPHVVVTVGSAGVAWATATDHGMVAAFEVDTLNPIGAGDAFLGGLMSRLVAGSPFSAAIAWGAATAASAVTQWIPGQADADQIRLFMEQRP